MLTQLCFGMSDATSVSEAIDCAFFRALAEPRRIDVVSALLQLGGNGNVSQIAAHVDVDGSVVSRHLKELALAGVARVERRGRERWYTLDVEACLGQLDRVTGFLRNVRDGLPCC